jgi:hypothetical protein
MLRALFAFLFALASVHAARADDTRAHTFELRLSEGAHPPGDAPDVVAHVPADFDRKKPIDVVVFLHGFDCCARSLVATQATPCRTGEPPHRGWDLKNLHDAARTNTLLVVPQLAYLARTSGHHRYTRHGAFDRMLDEVLARVFIGTDRIPTANDVHAVTLVAHSGGYGALVPILRDPDRKVRVQTVVLLDALYAGTDVIASWALKEPEARIVSLHTSQAQTCRENALLKKRLQHGDLSSGGQDALSDAVRAHAFVIRRVRTAHADVPARHLADILLGLPFAPRP